MRNTRINKVTLFLLAFVFLLTPARTAHAAPKVGKLALDIRYSEDIPLWGDTFALVQIAVANTDESGLHYDIMKPKFEEGIDPVWRDIAAWDISEGGGIKADELKEIALSLELVVDLEDDQYDEEKTDTQGSATFSQIEDGLYLVVRKAIAPRNRNYNMDPFLVMVPQIDENGNINDDLIMPKIGSSSSEPSSGDPPPSSSDPPPSSSDPPPSSSDPPPSSSEPSSTRPPSSRDDDDDDDDDDDPPSRRPSSPSQPPPPPSSSGSSGLDIPEDEVPLDPWRCTECNCRFPEWVDPCSDCGAVGTVIFDDPSALASLPATGQLNWPVPVLISGGVVLFLIGLDLYRGRGKKPDEE